jgi:hypothetical protein
MSNLLEKASILLTPTAYDDGKILSVKPMDGSGDFDFTRNSSATRVNSQGLSEDMQTFGGNLVANGDFSQQGPELITNGDFSTDSDWSKAPGTTISDGKLNITAVSTDDRTYQNAGLVQGKNYKVDFEVSNYNSGSLSILMGKSATPNIGNISANGIYSFYQTSEGANLFFYFKGNLLDASIDNVSVKEVGQDWTLGTGWSIGDNKVINDGTSGSSDSLVYSSGFPTVSTKTYELSIVFDSYDITSSNAIIAMDAGAIPSSYNRVIARQGDQDNIVNGVYKFKFIASSSTAFSLYSRFGAKATISSVSLIEITEDTNLPRIDYSPYSGAGTCGHWLFEPQSTNTATYSNDFTQGDIFVASQPPSLTGSVLTSQQATSPDGTNNAWKLVDDNDGLINLSGLNYFGTRLITNNYNTISYFVKKQGSNNFVYLFTNGFDAGASGTWFDIQNGTLGNVSANHTANIENYGNGWYRISITMQTVTDVVGAFSLRLATSNGTSNILRDGTNGVYFFGVQAESDASRQFMTSYIPTSGSTVTRNQDAAFGSGNSSLISSTEGVLYLEVAALTSINSYESITLSDGGTQNRIRFQLLNTLNRGAFQVQVGSVNQMFSNIDFTDITDFNKVAIKYKQNDFSVWLNGVKIFTNTSGTIPTLNQLNFNSGSNFNYFEGKNKCVAVFKEALTDDELECLTSDETSFSSFNALALANNYTII